MLGPILCNLLRQPRQIVPALGILRREDQIFTTISGIANECRAGKKSIEQAAEDIYGRLAIYQAEHN